MQKTLELWIGEANAAQRWQQIAAAVAKVLMNGRIKRRMGLHLREACRAVWQATRGGDPAAEPWGRSLEEWGEVELVCSTDFALQVLATAEKHGLLAINRSDGLRRASRYRINWAAILTPAGVAVTSGNVAATSGNVAATSGNVAATSGNGIPAEKLPMGIPTDNASRAAPKSNQTKEQDLSRSPNFQIKRTSIDLEVSRDPGLEAIDEILPKVARSAVEQSLRADPERLYAAAVVMIENAMEVPAGSRYVVARAAGFVADGSASIGQLRQAVAEVCQQRRSPRGCDTPIALLHFLLRRWPGWRERFRPKASGHRPREPP